MKMKNKQSTAVLFTVLCSLLFLSLPVFLSAQQSTAQEIETLLNASAVTYAQAARFALEASGAAVIESPQEAFDYAVQQNFLPKNVSVDENARLDRISLLLMRSFNIKGGLFYSLFKTPHYAYRELISLNLIQGRSDPHMAVSGERLLFYITRILSRGEN